MDRTLPAKQQSEEEKKKERQEYRERRRKYVQWLLAVMKKINGESARNLLVWQMYIEEGLTHKEIAYFIGVSRSCVSRWIGAIKKLSKNQFTKSP